MKKKQQRKNVEFDRPRLGQINRAIDDIFHPHFHKGPVPIILDTLAHAIVERDPKVSVEKFLEFNLGPFVREVSKLTRSRKRKRSK